MHFGIPLQLVVLLEQLLLSSLAFFESSPQRVDLDFPSNNTVLVDGVSMRRALEMEIMHWMYRWLLLLNDLRWLLLLGLDDVIIRHFLLLPLGRWLDLLGLCSSGHRNIDGLFGHTLALLGVGLLGNFLLSRGDFLVQPRAIVAQLVLKMVHEIFVEWSRLEIFLTLNLLPELIILYHMWNQVPGEDIINDNIFCPHFILDEVVYEDDL